jgi:hypothetical protein
LEREGIMKKKFWAAGLLCVMFTVFIFALFMCVFFTACEDSKEEEDYSIGEITITGIPAQIPVMGDEGVLNDTYKVYLNASNSQSENDAPAAKGVREISPDMKKEDGGTYTVTINIQNPNPPDKEDPNLDTGPWYGTARYFSVVISPQDVTGGVKTIWARAGTTLDKGKKSCDWNSLMNFRELIKNDPEDKMEFAKKANALYTDIVRKDPDITK